jgi:hypothetical protein
VAAPGRGADAIDAEVVAPLVEALGRAGLDADAMAVAGAADILVGGPGQPGALIARTADVVRTAELPADVDRPVVQRHGATVRFVVSGAGTPAQRSELLRRRLARDLGGIAGVDRVDACDAVDSCRAWYDGAPVLVGVVQLRTAQAAGAVHDRLRVLDADGPADLTWAGGRNRRLRQVRLAMAPGSAAAYATPFVRLAGPRPDRPLLAETGGRLRPPDQLDLWLAADDEEIGALLVRLRREPQVIAAREVGGRRDLPAMLACDAAAQLDPAAGALPAARHPDARYRHRGRPALPIWLDADPRNHDRALTDARATLPPGCTLDPIPVDRW